MRETPSLQLRGSSPFRELVGVSIVSASEGQSRCMLQIGDRHHNVYGSAHGGATFTLVDSGMGAALISCLGEDEACSTIEIKIVYLMQVRAGALECDSRVMHRTRRLAVLESAITQDGNLVAKALGTWSVYQPKHT